MKILKSSDDRAGQMEIEFEEEDFHCYGAKSLTPLRFFYIPRPYRGPMETFVFHDNPDK